jgi:hypothetical protein
MGYEEFLLGMDGKGRVYADVGALTDWTKGTEGWCHVKGSIQLCIYRAVVNPLVGRYHHIFITRAPKYQRLHLITNFDQ